MNLLKKSITKHKLKEAETLLINRDNFALQKP